MSFLLVFVNDEILLCVHNNFYHQRTTDYSYINISYSVDLNFSYQTKIFSKGVTKFTQVDVGCG